LLEDSHIECFGETVTIFDQLDALGNERRISELLQDWPVLNEMANVRKTQEGLLNHDLVIVGFTLAGASVLCRVLLVKLELSDRFGDNLFERLEKARIDDELRVLSLFN